MDTPATYVHWMFIDISVPNLLLILLMIVVFAMALLLPFPRHKATPALDNAESSVTEQPEVPADPSNWTARVREFVSSRWPWHQLLPDRQPAYVASWVYMFGIGAIAALLWIVTSGVILVIFGPTWWHLSSAGRLVNSIHFWSVQLFFFFLVLHLWGNYFMAAWRHGRAIVWFFGVLIFGLAIASAFTGYLSQQNLDAQWIALNGKDAINGIGVGSFFNVLDYGQMFGLHVMLLPLGVISLVVIHVLLIRMKGVVRPIGDDIGEDEAEADGGEVARS
jgi:ubiquinol-cytochrome c reductase cytochrome b subunit